MIFELNLIIILGHNKLLNDIFHVIFNHLMFYTF